MPIRFASLAAVGLLAAGCHVGADAEDRDPGSEVTRSYQVGAFDRLEVAGPYEVNVVTGGQGGVTAKGGENLLAETEVIVEDNVLKIQPKKKKGVRWNWRSGKAVFTVNAAALRGASIAGSGGVTVDKVAGDFEGEVAGSGDLKVAQIAGGRVKFDIAGSGNVKASASDSANVSIMGSGDVDISGGAKCKVSKAGSGDVRCG